MSQKANLAAAVELLRTNQDPHADPSAFHRSFQKKFDAYVDSRNKDGNVFVLPNTSQDLGDLVEQVWGLPSSFRTDRFARVSSRAKTNDARNARVGGVAIHCNKCNMQTTGTVVLQQTRGSDEPLTRFVTCDKCNNTTTDD